MVLLKWAVFLSFSAIGQELGYARLSELLDQLLLDVNSLAAVIVFSITCARPSGRVRMKLVSGRLMVLGSCVETIILHYGCLKLLQRHAHLLLWQITMRQL
jgi:hypothetical protein